MSGEEALRRIAAARAGVPVILSSGYTEAEALRRFGGQGLAGFLQKPYQAATLAAKVAGSGGWRLVRRRVHPPPQLGLPEHPRVTPQHLPVRADQHQFRDPADVVRLRRGPCLVHQRRQGNPVVPQIVARVVLRAETDGRDLDAPARGTPRTSGSAAEAAGGRCRRRSSRTPAAPDGPCTREVNPPAIGLGQ